MGGYERRSEEWNFQLDQAAREIDQIDRQIAAATIRQAISEQELRNHELQIEQTKTVDEFIRSRKFTRKDLYDWMAAQLSAVYFQAHQLAYDLAKRAERAYQFERGLTESHFVHFGQWDSLRRGLLAGEQLALDLKRLEATYLDQNRRDYEITKHISLVLHDPLALISLKTTGQCVVRLPETLFDADYPGHYMRRIKSVSLSIPAVVGPYTSVNCTLTLLSNKTRVKDTPTRPYSEQIDSADPDNRFVTNFAATQSIATSHAQNDSGMFELNFLDERYLAFEGAGAISEWRIEMPKDTNAFSFDTVTDVVMKVNYTARDGGEELRSEARQELGLDPGTPSREPPPAIRRMFSLRHEFAVEWARFLQSADPHAIEFSLAPERLPFRLRGRATFVRGFDVFWLKKDAETAAPTSVTVCTPSGEVIRSPLREDWEMQSDATFNDVPHAVIESVNRETGALRDGQLNYTWSLAANYVGANFGASQIEDILVVCELTSSRR